MASKWPFCPESPEIAQLWTPATLKPHNFRSRPPIELPSKQSCGSRRDLSNGMSHVLCSQVFRVDSRLLVVGSQNWRTPGSSTPGPSFGHNLCFRCPNEQCDPILDIYTSRSFHWYNERNKSLSFDPSKRSLKFRESFWDSNSHQFPTWEFTWECEGSLPHTLCTPGSMWYGSRVYL